MSSRNSYELILTLDFSVRINFDYFLQGMLSFSCPVQSSLSIAPSFLQVQNLRLILQLRIFENQDQNESLTISIL